MVLVLANCRRLGYILAEFRDIFANLHDRNSLLVHLVSASSSASHGAPSQWVSVSFCVPEKQLFSKFQSLLSEEVY